MRGTHIAIGAGIVLVIVVVVWATMLLLRKPFNKRLADAVHDGMHYTEAVAAMRDLVPGVRVDVFKRGDTETYQNVRDVVALEVDEAGRVTGFWYAYPGHPIYNSTLPELKHGGMVARF